MFAVVKNKSNAYYVVRKAWLSQIDDDGKVYTYFPTPAKMKKCLQKGTNVKESWKFEEVIIELNDVQEQKEADNFIETKIQFLNSDMEKEEQNKKRKLNETMSLEEDDFNQAFAEALDESLLDRTVPSENSQQSATNNIECVNFSTSHHGNISQNQSQFTTHENMVLVSKESLDLLVKEIHDIKIGQQNQIAAMHQFMDMVRQEFKSFRTEINTQKSELFEISYKPPVITSLEQLDEMEAKLGSLEESFLNEYKAMINYYSATVSSPNKNFNIQNGLVHSLMKAYLDINFAKTLIWSSVKSTIGFDQYKNHIRLFFIICNKILHSTGNKEFSNTAETEGSIQKFFKSIHATPRSKKTLVAGSGEISDGHMD